MCQHLAVAENHFLTDFLTLQFEQDIAYMYMYMYTTPTCTDFLHPTMPCTHLFCKEFCILLIHVSTETSLQQLETD